MCCGSDSTPVPPAINKHANTFNQLKGESDALRAKDLVRTFQAAGAGLSDEEANAYAAFAIDRVNDDPEDTVEGKESMDFDEYMRGMEAGTMIKWSRFKMLLNKRLKLHGPRKAPVESVDIDRGHSEGPRVRV